MTRTIFIISNSDGDVRIRQVTEAEFLNKLADGAYGTPPIFITDLDEPDTNYWPEGAICVIRGTIAIPTSKEVVTAWELPAG